MTTCRIASHATYEVSKKLLLGEDKSDSGKGVSTAVTVSDAITNLYASKFGQQQKLEPLHLEKKMTCKREMNCLLSVCDYIVEFVPTSHNLHNGNPMEVMFSRPRSDIYINLPALKKLDALLLVMSSLPRSDIYINLPALKKLDGYLLVKLCSRGGQMEVGRVR